MNYNKWFYDQHRYLTGNRNGNITFNDTKWADINDRYKTIIDEGSKLLEEQPFGVMGNNKGFDKLIDLMSKSNYTFEDVNGSLIKTYKQSLKNSMSDMLVNTRAVMFHCNTNDQDKVTPDRFTHYRIISVPFDQLHFGSRDEFIRQRLHMMHTTENDYYVPMTKFLTSEVTDILGFTIICTVNGYICNDCMVAIDDKGFKFKIGWLYSSDAEFIIYKLDESFIGVYEIESKYITPSGRIPYSVMNNVGRYNKMAGKKCIVNIYDGNFIKSDMSVPNFGEFVQEGIEIRHIQEKTLSDIKRHNSTKVTMVVYAINYLHEIPNVYPACNYYDIMDTRLVYTEKGDNVKNVDNNRIVSNSTKNVNKLERCTPPIVLDRPINLSFKTILECVGLYDKLSAIDNLFHSIGMLLKSNNLDNAFWGQFFSTVNTIMKTISECYISYLNGATLTSLVPAENVSTFKQLYDKLKKMQSDISRGSTKAELQKYAYDEFYEDNYMRFVKKVTEPFRDNALSNFTDLDKLSYNYFDDENYTRFNRPISEQCFIALKYDRDAGAWLFDYPSIKHFKGIENSFYIDNDLKGNEIFKFFVLYTDTKDPAEKNIESLPLEKVLDFDMFCNEAEKHMGYLRYWYAENKLLKISKLMYDKYDGETCVQVLSKILKRKIDADDILDIYPSDINYEASNITSDNLHAGENDDRAPFAINFLFYTLSMLYDNEDKLQAYFFRSLTDNKFSNRYADININKLLNDSDKCKVNYSYVSLAPNMIDKQSSSLPLNQSACAYYGLPLILSPTGAVISSKPYRYTFNVYEEGIEYPFIVENDIDKSYFVKYSDMKSYGSSKVSYRDDIQIAKMITLYLTSLYDYISDISTNYQTSFNQTSRLSSGIETLQKHSKKINDYIHDETHMFSHPDTLNIANSITVNEPGTSLFEKIIEITNNILICEYNGRSISFVEFINEIISLLKQVYVTTGFDELALKRARMLYIHLKKINGKLNIYEYDKWLNDIDMNMIENLDKVLAANQDISPSFASFHVMWDTLRKYKQSVSTYIEELKSTIHDIETYYDNNILKFAEYCDDIVNNYIFDLYVLENIRYDKSSSYSKKPYLVSVTFKHDSSPHFNPPVGTGDVGDLTLFFQPFVEQIDGLYYIRDIHKMCEYTFFSGEDITNCTLNVLDSNNQTISTINNVSFTFIRVSSTADVSESFDQLINIQNTIVDIENIHESFDVNSDGLITNKHHADMNYELLIGNHFTQLNHESEYVLNMKTFTQGPVDRVIMNNQMINKMVNEDYSGHLSARMFFKPCQIFHPDTVDGVMESIGGKYYKGQHIYLATDDHKYIFPAIVTSIDHSITRGFVEAAVDSFNSKWFNIKDSTEITRYLTTNIPCTIIDDNIRNFLDEYNNGEYVSYSNAEFNLDVEVSDEDIPNAYSFPGDPVFVQNNSEFIYTRLNWIFNGLVPNNSIDESTDTHKFIYIGDGFISNEEDSIKIKMVNFNLNNLTNPEMYPVLREEPNDHEIWDLEIKTFTQAKYASEMRVANGISRSIAFAQNNLDNAKTEYDRNKWLNELDSLQKKLQYEEEFQKRMDSYIAQLESPTKWYSVRAYEDTLVYIANGRAKYGSPNFISNIRDIPYTDKLDVFLYDWEHKYWIDPSLYTITMNMVDGVKIDEYDGYTTNNVLHSITITPSGDFVPSQKILVYISYDKSDVFSDIPTHDDSTCLVRFKPVLSLDCVDQPFDPYGEIKVRKHFDGIETYKFEDFNPPTDFSIGEAFHIKRPMRTGHYTNSPVIRMCDVSLETNNNTYDFTNLDLYVKIPFKDVTTSRLFKVPTYTAKINQPIDSFESNQIVKLICIQNNNLSSYDGNISSVMFEALTSTNSDGSQALTITNTTISNVEEAEYVCCVFKDDMYKSCGGLITVNIKIEEMNTLDGNKSWVKIPSSLVIHREIPNECIIVPKSTVQFGSDHSTKIFFKNKYEKTSNDVVRIDNSGTFNPFEYYFDTKNEVRLPISDVRRNNESERLIINKDLNPDVKLIKSSYIGICRFSLMKIPQNGYINMTGYLPTPLSRKRYEFWVNGRNIVNPDDLIILSPTSIQLCNMTSLRNFEVIELVDDSVDSNIIRKGNVYVDLNGNTFSSYNLALRSNSNITKQDIKYMFNANQHQQIHDYTNNIITNPNNSDIEKDILENINVDNSSVVSYDELYNTPSLNGIPLYHPTVQSLGITDIPNEKITELFDKVWKKEITTDPLFPKTHRIDIHDQYLKLHIRESNSNYSNILKCDTSNMYVLYTSGTTSKYFTLYISKKSDGEIDDVENTVKIIPFIKTGVYVLISKSFKGMWLHSTFPNTKTIHIL